MEDPANGGLVLVASRLADLDGCQRAVALLTDLNAFGFANPGASATNAAAWVVARYAAKLARILDVSLQNIQWVEVDSDGSYDMIHHSFLPSARGGGQSVPTVEWTPLRYPPFEPRTHRAFLGAFGKKGRHLLNATMIASVGMPAPERVSNG